MKIIKVKSCGIQCPYYTYKWCGKSVRNNDIKEGDPDFPSWCPLEDREDIKELIDCEIDCIVSGNSLSPSEQEIAINTCNNLKKRIGVEI